MLALPGCVLSYDPATPIAVGASGKITIGVKLGEGRLAAGRFCTIEWPYIKPDAAGLMGVFFTKSDDGPLISSSQSLIGGDVLGRHPHKFRGINWDPVPGSRSPSVRSLLRDQQLHLEDLRVEAIDATPRALGSIGEAKQALIEALKCSLTNLSGSLFLALTGGKDSRTIAAVMISSGIPFEAYTQINPKMPKSDLSIPIDICSRYGIRHHIIRPNRRDNMNISRWDEHTYRSINDGDNNYYFPYDQFRLFVEGDFLIRGSGFEVGRRFYRHQLGDLTFDTATGRLICDRMSSTGDEWTAAFLDEWLEWRRIHNGGLDLVDSFYLDQRMGAWVPAAEQSLDSIAGTSIQPANSLAAYDALITPNIEERISGLLQEEVIRFLEPALLEFPFNPPPGMIRRVRKASRKFLGRVKQRVLSQ